MCVYSLEFCRCGKMCSSAWKSDSLYLCVPVLNNRFHLGGSSGSVSGFILICFVLNAGTPSAQTVSVSAKVGAPVSLAGQRFTVQIPSSQPAGKSGIPGVPGMETGVTTQPQAACLGIRAQRHPPCCSRLPWNTGSDGAALGISSLLPHSRSFQCEFPFPARTSPSWAAPSPPCILTPLGMNPPEHSGSTALYEPGIIQGLLQSFQ